MNIMYRKAGLEDLDLLVNMRIEALHFSNDISEAEDLSGLAERIRNYYYDALINGRHTAVLVYDGDQAIACGNISYYEVLPTYCRPSGKKGYISNMYVRTAYRRKGIAGKILEILIDDAHERGINDILLEATEEGRHLYEKRGFEYMKDEMELLGDEE